MVVNGEALDAHPHPARRRAMLQVLQAVKGGDLLVADVPAPTLSRGFVVVRNVASVVSPGTERAIIDLAQKSLVGKARERPDLVRQVVDKVSRDGLVSTFAAVSGKLESHLPLGYSCCGVVEQVDDTVVDFTVGDRVACAGAGYANHAEVIRVPKNLCVRVPSNVDSLDAAATTIGAIALQGVRVASPTMGETVAVVGLGLLGLITVQLLVAAGCNVIGIEPAVDRHALALAFGASFCLGAESDVESAVMGATAGAGADAIIITASTPDSSPIETAGRIARHRGRVVMVGATGMEIPRRIFYPKELQFLMSTSYGPGRYDPSYEEAGNDYPIGYVRWTENRNMLEVLRQLSIGRLNFAKLRTHSFAIANARAAYELVTSGRERPIAITLTYPATPQPVPTPSHHVAVATGARLRIGLIGAGAYASGMLVPRLIEHPGLALTHVVSRGGQTAFELAKRFRIPNVATDTAALLADPNVDAVVIATRHDSHASLVKAALRAGKHVFVEKPLATSVDDVGEIASVHAEAQRVLMVGFNRDFAPATEWLLRQLGDWRAPRQIFIRCNAGALPMASWVHEKGGRWVGEGCHFVALAARLANSPFVSGQAVTSRTGAANSGRENVTALFGFENGSSATILYTALGDRAFPKERVEVFAGGSAGVIDDFRSALFVENGRERRHRQWAQDKGQATLVTAFVNACTKGTGTETTARMVDASAWTLRCLKVDPVA